MIAIRKSGDRGHADRGWLNSYHTFSFAASSDPEFMGFRALRVLNDDRIAAGKGFGAHGHRDMEILTYVVEGTLAHADSMGERHELGPNEVQAMSAGTGVIHSEFNASKTQPVHLFQIWITPTATDFPPSYQQFAYDPAEKRGKLRLIAGPDRKTNPPAAVIHQDARMYAAVLADGESIDFDMAAGRYAWVHCAAGSITVNGLSLQDGDGAAVSDESRLAIRGAGSSGGEVLALRFGVRLRDIMGDVNVLVVFYSRYGRAEKLALAAGLGAIQANANIRLRRVADAADQKTIESDQAWKDNLERMQMDYVCPRPDDPVWADVIVLGTPAEPSIEMERFVRSLGSAGAASPMTGKIAAPIAHEDSESALGVLFAASAHAGLIVVPAAAHASADAFARARAHGQRVSELARALKPRATGDAGARV